MRLVIALLVTLGLGAAGFAPAMAAEASAGGPVIALAQQPGQYSIDIDVDDGGAWWANPTYIGMGVVALVLLIVIIALATRGGGTTIIKE